MHGRIRHPQTQGKDERFHRTLKNDLLKGRAFLDLADAQAAFDPFRKEYNEERPHEALQLDVPAKFYRPSKRTLSEYDKPVIYDSGARLRKVNVKGYISICQKRYFLSESLIGQHIQLNDCGENVVALQYGQFEIARIDLEQQMFISKRRSKVR